MGEMVEVVWKDGNKYKVYVDEITYGQRCKILERAMKGKMSGGLDVEVNVMEIERGLLVESIKRIEPEVSVSKDEFVNGLPVKESMKLIDVVTKINPLGF